MNFKSYVKLGLMKAEVEDAFSRINEECVEAQNQDLRDAFSSLLGNDLTKRDDACTRAEMAVEICRLKKMEAARRIGEKYGMNSETAERIARKAFAK